MPVLEQFRGIVIRMIYDRTLGARLHAFYEGAELVVAMQPVCVLQGEVPEWVRDWVVAWARDHVDDVMRMVGGVVPAGKRPIVGSMGARIPASCLA